MEKKYNSISIKNNESFLNRKYKKINVINYENKYNNILRKKKEYFLNKVLNEINKKNKNKRNKKMKNKILLEFDNLNEKDSDKINYKIYFHIINYEKPWNSFRNFLEEERDNNDKFNENYYLVNNSYFNLEDNKELEKEIKDSIYKMNKEYIDDYLEKKINNPIDMNKNKLNNKNVLRFVSNSYSIPNNCIDSGLLYAGTDFHSGYINIMTNLPYGLWYKIDKRLDEKFDYTIFEKDLLLYGNNNLPTYYFDSIYNQADRYYDDSSWDILINKYEEEKEKDKQLIKENKKLLEELKNYDAYDKTYDEVYMDPKLYPSYYSDYDEEFDSYSDSD